MGQVQGLALGHAVDHVEQDDVAKLFNAGKMGDGAANLASADQCNPITRHENPLLGSAAFRVAATYELGGVG